MNDHAPGDETDDNAWITVEEAATILRVTPRMVNRYAHMDPSPLRTQKAGRRVIYTRKSVLALAKELNVEKKPEPPPPAPAQMSIWEPGEILEYLRERDRQLAEVQQQLNQALLELGRMGSIVERAQAIEQERDELRRRIEVLTAPPPAPWWKRLLGR